MGTQVLSEERRRIRQTVLAFTAGADGDRAKLRALMTDDVKLHDFMGMGAVLAGPDAVLTGFFSPLAEAIPDAHFEVADMLVGDDGAVVRGEFSGTFVNEYIGLPPTGRRVSWIAHDIYRTREGRIREIWLGNDTLHVARELGVVSPDVRPWTATEATTGAGGGTSGRAAR